MGRSRSAPRGSSAAVSAYRRLSKKKPSASQSRVQQVKPSTYGRGYASRPTAAPNSPVKAALAAKHAVKPTASAAFRGKPVAGSVANAVAGVRSKPSYRKPSVPLAGRGHGRPLRSRLGRVRQKLSSR